MNQPSNKIKMPKILWKIVLSFWLVYYKFTKNIFRAYSWTEEWVEYYYDEGFSPHQAIIEDWKEGGSGE